MKTMIPLDIMGKLDGFTETFDVDEYYRNRENRYREMIEFSMRPESSAAREAVRQNLKLAEEFRGEAGDLFREVYRRISNDQNR